MKAFVEAHNPVPDVESNNPTYTPLPRIPKQDPSVLSLKNPLIGGSHLMLMILY